MGLHVAALMLSPGEARDRLTAGIYLPASDDEPLNVLEQALQCAVVCETVEAKLRAAVKTGQIPVQADDKITYALKQRVITNTELELMGKMQSLRRRVITVDDFPPDFAQTSGRAQDAPDAAPLSVPEARAEAVDDDVSAYGNT
jgi:acyl-CoA dehydrogenase